VSHSEDRSYEDFEEPIEENGDKEGEERKEEFGREA